MSRLGEAGEEATSGALIRPASKPAMDNESERMVEASVDLTHLGNPEVRGAALWLAERWFSLASWEPGSLWLSIGMDL